ncbi:MAG: hypothetical protein WBA57_03695 [Elainellaceae cyanobacterium]
MAISHRRSLLMRSLKAKLSTLKRPKVWGAATVVLLASYVGLEYLIHPERLRFAGGTDSETGAANDTTNQAIGDRPLPLSDDNGIGVGIGVDIDSLPLLFDEIRVNDGTVSPSPEISAETEREASSENFEADQGSQNSSRSTNNPYGNPYGLLNENESNMLSDEDSRTSDIFYGQLFSAPPPAPTSSPFALQGSAESDEERLTPSSAWGLSSPRSTPSSSSRMSPLQDALGQQAADLSNQSESRSTIFEASPSGRSPLSAEFTPNVSYPGAVSSPSPGTTGYTSPAALRSPTNLYTGLTNPSIPSSAPSSAVTPTPTTSGTLGRGVTLPPSVPYQASPNSMGYPSAIPGTVTPGTTPYSGVTGLNQTEASGVIVLPNAQPNVSSPLNPNRRYTGGGRNGEMNTFSNP